MFCQSFPLLHLDRCFELKSLGVHITVLYCAMKQWQCPFSCPKGKGLVFNRKCKKYNSSGNTNHTPLVRKLSLQRGWGTCPVVHGVWATEWGPEAGPMGSNPGDISPDHRQNGRGTGLALPRESLDVHHTGSCLYPAPMASPCCEATNITNPQSWSGASLQKRRGNTAKEWRETKEKVSTGEEDGLSLMTGFCQLRERGL